MSLKISPGVKHHTRLITLSPISCYHPHYCSHPLVYATCWRPSLALTNQNAPSLNMINKVWEAWREFHTQRLVHNQAQDDNTHRYIGHVGLQGGDCQVLMRVNCHEEWSSTVIAKKKLWIIPYMNNIRGERIRWLSNWWVVDQCLHV